MNLKIMTADNFFNHAKKTFKDEISSINHSLDNYLKKTLIQFAFI